MDMFEIMDRESSSRSEVYLYEENGNGMHTTVRQACSRSWLPGLSSSGTMYAPSMVLCWRKWR